MTIDSQTHFTQRSARKSVLIARLLSKRLAKVRERVGTLRAEQAFLTTYLPLAEPGSDRWKKGAQRLIALRDGVAEVNGLFEEVLRDLPSDAAADASVQRLRMAVEQLQANMAAPPFRPVAASASQDVSER